MRRAGYVHDVGRVAVSAATWNSARPLSAEQREQVRMHPYYTQRVLGRSPFLRSLSEVASCHHERLDGSGYFRGATGAALSAPSRILAAADAYHTKTEARPHRPALDPARRPRTCAPRPTPGGWTGSRSTRCSRPPARRGRARAMTPG